MCQVFQSIYFPEKENQEGEEEEGPRQGRLLQPDRGRPQEAPPGGSQPLRGQGAGVGAALQGQILIGESV